MLDVAEAMLATRSLESVRISDIADQADVAIGTVYAHFGSKDGVLEAIAERALDRAAQYIEAAVTDMPAPLQRLAATGDAYLQLLIDYPSLAQFLLQASPEVTSRASSSIRERVGAMYNSLADAIEQCVESGDVIGEVNPAQVATFLISSWSGLILATSNTLTPPYTPHEARTTIEHAAQIILRGLTAR
jgi:AcrR family transcriptional regulator